MGERSREAVVLLDPDFGMPVGELPTAHPIKHLPARARILRQGLEQIVRQDGKPALADIATLPSAREIVGHRHTFHLHIHSDSPFSTVCC